MPEMAWVMLATRSLNRFLGTQLRPDEVGELDPLVFEVLRALQAGLGNGGVGP